MRLSVANIIAGSGSEHCLQDSLAIDVNHVQHTEDSDQGGGLHHRIPRPITATSLQRFRLEAAAKLGAPAHAQVTDLEPAAAAA